MEPFLYAGDKNILLTILLSSVTISESWVLLSLLCSFFWESWIPVRTTKTFIVLLLFAFTAPLFSRRLLCQPGCPPPAIKDQGAMQSWKILKLYRPQSPHLYGIWTGLLRRDHSRRWSLGSRAQWPGGIEAQGRGHTLPFSGAHGQETGCPFL